MLTPRGYLDNYWDGNLPVNMLSISNQLGVTVLEKEGLGDSFAILLYKNDRPIILLNQNESAIRKRFILTHALLDYLGTSEASQGQQDKTVITHYKKENCLLNNDSFYSAAINKRVMDFLIPPHILEFVVVQKNITKLESLSNLFGVSQALMVEALTKMTKKVGIVP